MYIVNGNSWRYLPDIFKGKALKLKRKDIPYCRKCLDIWATWYKTVGIRQSLQETLDTSTTLSKMTFRHKGNFAEFCRNNYNKAKKDYFRNKGNIAFRHKGTHPLVLPALLLAGITF